jgi:ketosteroid isomerase-like protein
MKIPSALLRVAFFLLPLAAVAAGDEARLRAELVKMENDFCAMASAQGVPAAFAHFAAPDAAFFDVDPREHRGQEAVRLRMAGFPPGAKLTWAPLQVDVAASGDLGYTWGRYEFRNPGADGQEHVGGGFYLTIWKRQPDGSWKFAIDAGTPDRPKPPPAPPVEAKPKS